MIHWTADAKVIVETGERYSELAKSLDPILPGAIYTCVWRSPMPRVLRGFSVSREVATVFSVECIAVGLTIVARDIKSLEPMVHDDEVPELDWRYAVPVGTELYWQVANTSGVPRRYEMRLYWANVMSVTMPRVTLLD